MDLSQLDSELKATLPMARIEARVLPGCPEIRLALINADFPLGPLPPEVMRDVIERPAYWALCWGSGLALARHVLDNPCRVAGRTVVDLGSGSGVVAVAAALAGARRVLACDTDPAARIATATNAALNDVELDVAEDLERIPEDNDLLLMADVLYDRSNLPLLSRAAGHASEVLVADSRLPCLPDPTYRLIGEFAAATFPNLGEFDEFTVARLYCRAASSEG